MESSPTESPMKKSARRGEGRRLPAGDENPGSRIARLIRADEFNAMKARVAELEERERVREQAVADVDIQAGVLTAERMRRVLSQRPEVDCGPTEKILREMLTNSPAAFIKQMEERERNERGVAAMEAENARLRDEVKSLNEKYSPPTDRDEGTAKARGVIERLLADFEAQEEAKRIAQCPTCGRGKDWKPAN